MAWQPNYVPSWKQIGGGETSLLVRACFLYGRDDFRLTIHCLIEYLYYFQ
jgi:hypothetical protein